MERYQWRQLSRLLMNFVITNGSQIELAKRMDIPSKDIASIYDGDFLIDENQISILINYAKSIDRKQTIRIINAFENPVKLKVIDNQKSSFNDQLKLRDTQKMLQDYEERFLTLQTCITSLKEELKNVSTKKANITIKKLTKENERLIERNEQITKINKELTLQSSKVTSLSEKSKTENEKIKKAYEKIMLQNKGLLELIETCSIKIDLEEDIRNIINKIATFNKRREVFDRQLDAFHKSKDATVKKALEVLDVKDLVSELQDRGFIVKFKEIDGKSPIVNLTRKE